MPKVDPTRVDRWEADAVGGTRRAPVVGQRRPDDAGVPWRRGAAGWRPGSPRGDLTSTANRSSLLLALLSTSLLTGCATAPQCARSSDCTGSEVCGFRGQCGPLGRPVGARFARSRWIEPSDWGIATRGPRAPLGDVMALGGDHATEALLAFGPMPEASAVLRALLVLAPHDRADRWPEPLELVVERVEPFVGGALPPRPGPQPLPFAAARRLLPAGPSRPLRVDVTASARQAGGRRDRHLYLLLRLRPAGDRLRLASPYHLRRQARPRLELLVY
ncbi:MAG: hypothetical protein ACFCGT_19200 [Sandaracinaceae bacterium]